MTDDRRFLPLPMMRLDSKVLLIPQIRSCLFFLHTWSNGCEQGKYTQKVIGETASAAVSV